MYQNLRGIPEIGLSHTHSFYIAILLRPNE